MRLLFKIILGIIVFGVAVFALVMLLTSGERKLGKSFVTLASSGASSEARALLHPTLQEEFTLDRFQEVFGNVKPYTEVSFGSVEKNASGTSMSGSATTADGCATSVEIAVLAGQIIQFRMNPLCFR